MFHRSLPSIFLLVMAVLAGSSPARAAIDVDQIVLTVTVAKTSLGSDEFTASLRVEGTDMNNGTLQLPSGPTQFPLKKDGVDLVLDQDFDSELELNTALPAGNYVLRLNNGNVVVTIPYTRPTVPSPAISQPDAGQILPPGPVEVLFTECALCSQVGDSTDAVLEDGGGNALVEEMLTPSSDSWIPSDGMGGDYQLAPVSAFVTRVTHSTVRQSNPAIDDVDDAVLFSGVYVQSDELDFETGFEPPVGTVCLSVNHPMPPAGCVAYADPLLSVIDTTGTFTTQIDGHDVDVTVTVGPSGSLSGSASADLDDSGLNETGPSPIKGKLGGSGDERDQKLSTSLENEAFLAKLKLSVTDQFLLTSDVRNQTVRGSGSLNGVKIKEESTSSDSPIPTPPLGWYVQFDVDGSTEVQNASLTLEGGRSFALTGSNKFNFAADESSIKLVSDPKGISIQLKKAVLDDSDDPLDILGGDFSFKILGQSGRGSFVP